MKKIIITLLFTLFISSCTYNSNTPLVEEAWKIWLNTNELNKCIAENKFVDKINYQMELWNKTFGITWTPGNVLINNETLEYTIISWAYPKEWFIQQIELLLSDKTEKNIENKDISNNKTFEENTDKNKFVLISDKRDSTPVGDIIKWLKEINWIKELQLEQYDFSDEWVKEYLEKNNIEKLPAIIFSNNKIDENINKFLTKINDNSYSLNIWAKFNPFMKLSSKWLPIIDKKIIEEIKEKSYIKWNKDAKITWLEYSDLECPFCQKLHNSDVEDSLKEKYWDDLNIIYNHFPLGFHKKAIPWANILECVWELGWNEAFYHILEYAYKNHIQK